MIGFREVSAQIFLPQNRVVCLCFFSAHAKHVRGEHKNAIASTGWYEQCGRYGRINLP